MSKIQEYYELVDRLEAMFGGKLSDKQNKMLEELEDSLIAEEILPAISESVAPVLSILRRHLTLVVDYDPQGGITVKTTRGEVVVKEHSAKKYEIPSTNKVIKVAEAQKQNGSEEQPATHKVIKRSPNTGLCIWLPNGDFIQGKKASKTMAAAVEQAGVEHVAALKIPHDNSYLVSKEVHPKYADNQQNLSHGYLLNTHSNNQTKVKQLTRISHELKLGWRVEQIK